MWTLICTKVRQNCSAQCSRSYILINTLASKVEYGTYSEKLFEVHKLTKPGALCGCKKSCLTMWDF